jgi:hypothetical protein
MNYDIRITNMPKDEDVKSNTIGSMVNSQVGIHSSQYMRHAPAVQSYRHHLGDRMWNNSLPIPGFPSTLDCGLALARETFLSDFQNIRGVRHAKEVLRVMQAIGLGIRMRQLRIDSRFPKRFASYFREANEVVMFASVIGYFNDFGKVDWIFSLDI